MIRSILDWSDAKHEELVNDKSKGSWAKTIGLGVLEGFVNTCAFVGAYGFVLTIVDKVVNLKK